MNSGVESEVVFCYVCAQTIDTCKAKMKEMDELSDDVQRAIDICKHKIWQIWKRTEATAVIDMIVESSKRKIWKIGKLREEVENELCFPEDVANWQMLVPVDISNTAGKYNSLQDMVEKLGARATVEAIEKGRENMKRNTNNIPNSKRPKAMTAAEYRAMYGYAECSECAEEDGEEEEEAEEEEELIEEAEAAVSGDECEEPVSKKTKIGLPRRRSS